MSVNNNFRISKRVALGTLGLAFTGVTFACMMPSVNYDKGFDDILQQSFYAQGLQLNPMQLSQIRDNALLGVQEACKNTGNSKLGFTAVEIAQTLQLNMQTDTQVVGRISEALNQVAKSREYCNPNSRMLPPQLTPLGWSEYYDKTLSLNNNDNFLKQLREKEYSPVKISWEDIGRYQESVWGDRISDVGIWVRKNEKDLNSAQLALSVRRDNNYRDKILVVPAEKIKVHQKVGSQTIEKTLPERLKELGLSSPLRDKNVIVSNQFSIVPVPAYSTAMTRTKNVAPRAAFNFSIYPYGSTNYVITDVIEGSSDAIVGQGNHQLLYANINGQKAPFTASRASERQDLLQLEQKLKSQGMDVDVQRYYLIQIPLKRDAQGLQLSNMGTPPGMRNQDYDYELSPVLSSPMLNGGASAENKAYKADAQMKSTMRVRSSSKGLDKVAIGHGDAEGRYFGGSGFYGQRADEPIRVTVVYFVTPVGEVTQADIEQFTKTFANWDSQAIWGGSFVTKQS